MRQQHGATGALGEVIFRGARLGPEEWSWIQRLVDERECRTRLDVVREVCRRFAWRQPSGAYAVDAVRLLLARCERRGLIQLPAPQYRASNWIELGETQGFARVRGGRYELHGRPKRVFVYPLHRRARERLCATQVWPSTVRGVQTEG